MFKQTTDKRVAALIAPGLEECEALIVVDLLYRAGIPCDLIAVSDAIEVTSSHEITVRCNKRISDTNFDEYDMIFLPGGIPGTPNLAANELVQEAIKLFVAQDKEVAAICAAPSILAKAGVLSGRRATSNPNFQHVLSENGADLQTNTPVVRDGHITTSQGMGTAMLLGFALVEVILGKDAVLPLKQGVVYPY